MPTPWQSQIDLWEKQFQPDRRHFTETELAQIARLFFCPDKNSVHDDSNEI